MLGFKDEIGRLKYRSVLPGLETARFYPYQVSGAATSLVSMVGYVPLPDDAPETARKAAEDLKTRGVAIGGKFIGDQTGMGKSMLMLTILYYARYHKIFDSNGNRIFKITALSVPSGVIKKWADEIIDNFPTLKLLISYEDTGLSAAKYESCLANSTAMKNPDSPEFWAERHQYIFDKHNPDTGATIILTSHDTAVTRTLREEEVLQKEGEQHNSPRKDKDGNPIWKTEPKMKRVFHGRFDGRIGIAAIDEAQKLKDKRTLRWKAVAKFNAEYVFLLGATPMANVSSDIIGQIELLWPCAQRALNQATEEAQEWVTNRRNHISMFSDGEKEIKDASDIRRIGYIHPGTVRYLLENGTYVDKSRYFPLCAELFCLARSMASKIPFDFNNSEYYECKTHIKPGLIQTTATEFLPEEKAEQQHQHRDASLRFLKAMRGAAQKAGGKDDRPVYPVAEMRELQLAAASTNLKLFNDLCKKIGKDTLVASMESYRGFDGWSFVRFLAVYTQTAVPKTAIEYIQAICQGSPLLRCLIRILCFEDQFLKPRKKGKLFILEDTPLIAMFLTSGLNMFSVNTALFKSGLGNAERNEIRASFNDKNPNLDIMVWLYDVGAGSVDHNFYVDLHTAILTNSGKSQAAEMQGIGRLVRASLLKQVFGVDVC